MKIRAWLSAEDQSLRFAVLEFFISPFSQTKLNLNNFSKAFFYESNKKILHEVNDESILL
jgi:hypothetical protein